jgi:uncharacterized protein (TIGR03437 family)
MGDVVLSCTGRPGDVITGNLTVSLNTTVTNRINNGRSDAPLTVDIGSGRRVLATPEPLGENRLVYAGLRFEIGPYGSTELRVTNLRGDASRGTSGLATITATLAFNPPSLLAMQTPTVVVGVPQRGLFATTAPGSVASQIGSPLPEEITFSSLISTGTRFSSTRITEGFAGAFEPRDATSDTGTRILLRFSGYPANARVFTPNVVIGSGGNPPTSVGQFSGSGVTPGQYAPGALTLIRVLGVNASGAGGYPATVPSSGNNQVSEVSLMSGAGVAVYEVVESNPVAIETAQIPVFIGLPRTIEGYTLTTQLQVSLGPLATTVPRYVTPDPTPDCTSFRDCALYLPKLEAYPQHTDFVAVSGVMYQNRFFRIENIGGGVMVWTARVEFKNGGNTWLRVAPDDRAVAAMTVSGTGDSVLRLDVIPAGLAPGKYEGALVVDAGPAGIARWPVTLEVRQLPPEAPRPTISSVGSAATFSGAIAPGGLATLRGTNLSGNNIVVTVGGKAARILFSGADQINVEVPADVSGTSTQVIVTVNGVAGPAQTVQLASIAPGVFSGGVLNQDGRRNAPENPALPDTVLQTFATGLLPAQGQAAVEVQFADTFYSGASSIHYANQAPGLQGVQQVNFKLPAGLPTATYDLKLCATAPGTGRVCSPGYAVHVRAQ